MSTEKLGSFLKEVSNWDWEEFCRAESNKTYTSNQAMIFSLIRSCAMQKMDAIRVSLNRLDGKLKTPIKIELPKVFYLFPNAQLEAPDVPAQPKLPTVKDAPPADVVSGELIVQDKPEPEVVDLPSMTLRETLAKMADYPRDVPEAVTQFATETQQWLQGKGPKPPEIPRVKSVVAAHLLVMAQNRDVGALTEVFDQIDGKLAETIQLLGDDIYITSYITSAPPGAYLNDDGVLQLEAEAAQNLWAQKLGGQSGRI
jgi:hypothetical protein